MMEPSRDSIIPPSVDIFHHRALQERSPNPRQEYRNGFPKHGTSYYKVEQPIYAGSDSSFQRSIQNLTEPRNILKPKLSPFEKEQVFQKLWMRAWACDNFTKYRKNQKKCSKRAKDQIWSDRNEYLFFRGLVEFWPTGRVQQIDDRFKPKKAKGKPEFGRNELIARWMGQELGYEIKRKEISSHLQVLKAKFRGEVAKDDFVLYWLGLDPKKPESKHVEGMPDLIPRQVQRDDHILEPVQFDMRIRETDLYGQIDNTAHVLAYSTASAKKVDQYLTAMPAWRRDYPDLSNILDDAHHQGVEIMLVDCPIRLIKATELRNIRTNAANKNCSVDLSIQNKFRLRSHISSQETWDCTTTFFQKGEMVDRWANHVPTRIKTDAAHTHWDGESQTLMIPFQSDHWLDMICNFADSLNDPAEAVAVEQEVEDMLAVQEIHKHQKSTDGDEATEQSTVLVILWTFHSSTRDKPVPTTWHSVFLPFGSIQQTGPARYDTESEQQAGDSVPSYLDYDHPGLLQGFAEQDNTHELPNYRDMRNNSSDIDFHGGHDLHSMHPMTQAGVQLGQGFDFAAYQAAAMPDLGPNTEHGLGATSSLRSTFDPHSFDDFQTTDGVALPHSSHIDSHPLYDPYYQLQQSQTQVGATGHRQSFFDGFSPHHASGILPTAAWFGAGLGQSLYQLGAPQQQSLPKHMAASFDFDLAEPSMDLAASSQRLQRLAALQPLHTVLPSSTASATGQPFQQQLQQQSQGRNPTTQLSCDHILGTNQPAAAYSAVFPTLASQSIADFPDPAMTSPASSPVAPARRSSRHQRSNAVAIAPFTVQDVQDSPAISPLHGRVGGAQTGAVDFDEGLGLVARDLERVDAYHGLRRRVRTREEASDGYGELEGGGVKRRRLAFDAGVGGDAA